MEEGKHKKIRYVDKKIRESRAVRISIVAIMIVILLVGCVILYYYEPRDIKGLFCIIHETTGFYCPGCGAGRACYAILHGQLYQAFRYNPLLVILLIPLIIYFGIVISQWMLRGRETLSERIPIWIPYAVLALVLLYGIVRNIPMYPFELLAPTKII